MAATWAMRSMIGLSRKSLGSAVACAPMRFSLTVTERHTDETASGPLRIDCTMQVRRSARIAPLRGMQALAGHWGSRIVCRGAPRRTEHGVSDRLFGVLPQDAHGPAQELLHEPEGTINLVVPGQYRRRLCALTGSLGQRRTDCGQLVPQSGILLGEPIDLSLE